LDPSPIAPCHPKDEADKDDYQTQSGGGKDYVVSEVSGSDRVRGKIGDRNPCSNPQCCSQGILKAPETIAFN